MFTELSMEEQHDITVFSVDSTWLLSVFLLLEQYFLSVLSVLQVIHHLEYEDDLDLTWVSVTTRDPNLNAHMCLYDNQTFHLLRDLDLGVMESVEEVNSCENNPTLA